MLVVLQGRVASQRLPGKGFFTFFGETVWERMCRIALATANVDEVIFATGDNPQNLILKPLIEAQKVNWFVGDEGNVLQRFVDATAHSRSEYLVRVTCDNYLAQPELIEGLIEQVRSESADYGYIAPLSHFAGEVIRIDALRECLRDGPSNEAREHVTWDIRTDSNYKQCVAPPDYGGVDHAKGLTLDSLDDLIEMKTLEQSQLELEPVRCLEAMRRIHPARDA